MFEKISVTCKSYRCFPLLTSYILFLLASVSILLIHIPAVYSAQITIAWDANTEPDLAGYKVYYGTSSGIYGISIEIGKATSHVLTGLTPGQGYFVAVTAYDTSSNESGYSLEVSGIAREATDNAIRDLLTEYYYDILDRSPDTGGLDFWTAEIERIVSMGIDPREGFQGAAGFFFSSMEYDLKNKNDIEFVSDLYETFLQRTPAQWEVDYWVSALGQGLTRSMLLTQFANSYEFKQYIDGVFGNGSVRPEINLLNDLYRGFLGRLPDAEGFNQWLGLMREAQCAGEQEVRDLTHQIALLFVQSQEYGLTNTNNLEYVEDLYNGILRRGADPAGFTYWVNLLNDGTYDRQQLLDFFVNSPEFQMRVQEVINAGCLN